jgi:cytochrome c-type biogenesis protein
MAMNTHNMLGGAILTICYSLGIGIPFIIIGVLWGFIMPFWKNINKYLGLISLISGFLLIIIGILFLTQWINDLRGFLGQFIHFQGL